MQKNIYQKINQNKQNTVPIMEKRQNYQKPCEQENFG